MPYFSTYVNRFDGETATKFNGGMDVKYVINDAFTFDMNLIPDFGKVNLDNSILNLIPFEQQPFFTEATELFSKGNLFYSKRIGSSPWVEAGLNNGEKITERPAKVKLVNALKISGRTNKG